MRLCWQWLVSHHKMTDKHQLELPPNLNRSVYPVFSYCRPSHGSQDLWREQNSKNWNWVFKMIFIRGFNQIFTKHRRPSHMLYVHILYCLISIVQQWIYHEEKTEEDPLLWARTWEAATVHKLQHSNLDKWTSDCAGLKQLMQDQRCNFTCVSDPRPPRKCKL